MRIYGDSTSINDLISNAMEKLKTIVDSSTIVGDQIVTSCGDTIIPISKVTVGFVVGGGEYADLSARRVANHFPMSGGSSGGMSVSPVGFLILHESGDVDFVNVENKSLYQTVLNMFNSLLAKMEKKSKEDACEDCACGQGESDCEGEQEVSEEDVQGYAEEEIAEKQKKNDLKKEEKKLRKEEKKLEKLERKKSRQKQSEKDTDDDLKFASVLHFDEAEDDEE